MRPPFIQQILLKRHYVPDPGGFVVCREKKFLYAIVYKNASTTIRTLIQEIDGRPGDRPIDFFGIRIDGLRRIPLSGGSEAEFAGYLRFAVYRDPVDRFLSVYRHLTDGRKLTERSYLASCKLADLRIDEFLAFTRRELLFPAVFQDQHLRPQYLSYTPGSVDFIVPMEKLQEFMSRQFGVSLAGRLNAAPEGGGAPVLTAAQEQAIRRLYRKDFAIAASFP